jgi:hypothetical protein
VPIKKIGSVVIFSYNTHNGKKTTGSKKWLWKSPACTTHFTGYNSVTAHPGGCHNCISRKFKLVVLSMLNLPKVMAPPLSKRFTKEAPGSRTRFCILFRIRWRVPKI